MSDLKEFYIEGEELSMAELLKSAAAPLPVDSENAVVSVKVIAVGKDDVTVDTGSKMELYIPIEEFVDSAGNLNIKVGDFVDVFVLSRNSSGIAKASYKKAKEILVMKELQYKFQNEIPIKAKVLSAKKGGFIVDIDVEAFMPASQSPFGISAENMIGKIFDVFILDIDNNVIVSAKKFIDRIKLKKTDELKKTLKLGSKVKGIVKSIKDYGAFVDLGGIDALLHVSEISWTKGVNPSEVLSVGQEIEVQILEIDFEKNKISVSIKQLIPNPWNSINFNINEILEGKVSKILESGAIISLQDGIDGYLHISELSWVEKVHKVSDVLKVGDSLRVKVLFFDKANKKLSLGLKQIEESPWQKFKANYQKNDKVLCKVTSISSLGLFVEIEKGVSGLIHSSDISWLHGETFDQKNFEIGQELNAVILNIDNKMQRLSLGLKQKEIDPILKYKYKNNYTCKISEVKQDEVIVKFDDGITGIIPRINTFENKTALLSDKFKIGDEISAKLVRIDQRKRELIFSLKEFEKEQEKKEIQEFMNANKDSNPTLGEMLSESLKNKLNEIKK